jgi:uncharacterized protein YbjT (DUF2867 family)
MKLVIVAATGRVGQQLLEQALEAGHEVTAIVRDPSKLTHAVRHVKADFANSDAAALVPALEGADAVLSALGARKKAEAGVATNGTRATLEAMDTVGVRRIIAISAGPVSTVPSPARPHPPKADPGDGFFMRHLLSPILKRALGWTYNDLAAMEDLLRDSGADWTVIRPSRLVNKRLTGSYRTAIGQNVRRGQSIARADVAHLMLALLTRPDTIHKTVGIAY